TTPPAPSPTPCPSPTLFRSHAHGRAAPSGRRTVRAACAALAARDRDARAAQRVRAAAQVTLGRPASSPRRGLRVRGDRPRRGSRALEVRCSARSGGEIRSGRVKNGRFCPIASSSRLRSGAMTKLTRAMSPASLVISILALAVATSMTSAVAATTATEKRLASSSVTSSALRNNAVTTNKIRNNAVTSKKIRKGAVTASKIKKGAVTASKIKKGAVTASKIKNGAVTNAKIKNGTIDIAKLSPKTIAALQGTQGPKGDTGPAGPVGPAGADGVSGYEVVTLPRSVSTGTGNNAPVVLCPAGKVAIGGGYQHVNGPAHSPYSSFPTEVGGQSGWGLYYSGVSGTFSIDMSVICISAS